MSGKFKRFIGGKKVCKDCPSIEMVEEIAELRRLLDLLTPDGWEHSEVRPGLRKTYAACEKILKRD